MTLSRMIRVAVCAIFISIGCYCPAHANRVPGGEQERPNNLEYAPTKGWEVTPYTDAEIQKLKRPQATLKTPLPKGPEKKDPALPGTGKTADALQPEVAVEKPKREARPRSAHQTRTGINDIGPMPRPARMERVIRVRFEDEAFMSPEAVEKLRSPPLSLDPKVDKLTRMLNKIDPITFLVGNTWWGIIPTRTGDGGIKIQFKIAANGGWDNMADWGTNPGDVLRLIEQRNDGSIELRHDGYWVLFRFKFSEDGNEVQYVGSEQGIP